MAGLGANALTLADHAKRMDPDGSVAQIIEMLVQRNEMLLDMPWIEGNLPTGHRTTIRTGLPDAYWRLINAGTQPSKSATAQIDEATGMLEAWSEVDTELLKLNGNSASFRLSEAKAFIQAMNQEMQSTILYGNAGVAPEEFNGLSVRYDDPTATNGANVIDMGGTDPADNTSIWLISWSPETVTGLFPKGSTAGLEHNDYGEQTVTVTAGVAGSRMRAMQEKFSWKGGLCVRNWEYAVRIGSIDVSALAGMSPADLIDALEEAAEIIPDDQGTKVLYANRTVRRYLRKQVREAVGNGGGLTFENFGGKKVMMFGDIPIRTCDAILNTEAPV